MNKLLLTAALILLTGTTSFAFATANKIVAIINREVVTEKDLNERLKFVIKSNNIDVKQVPVAQLKADTLKSLIDGKIISQEAKIQKIEVSKAEVDEMLANMAAQQHLSVPVFLDHLHKSGLDNTIVKEQVGNNILWEKFLAQHVLHKFEISDTEVTEFVSYQRPDKVLLHYRTFSTKNKTDTDHDAIQKVEQQSLSCKQINQKDFALKVSDTRMSLEQISSEKTRNILAGLTVDGAKSHIFEDGNSYKLIVLCSKTLNLSQTELDDDRHRLKLQKLESQSGKFLQNLRNKYFIEVRDLEQ